jgi:hypothetical protein
MTEKDSAKADAPVDDKSKSQPDAGAAKASAPAKKASAKKAAPRKPATAAAPADDKPAAKEQPKRGPGYDEPAIATEGQLAGEHEGNPNPVMLRYDDYGEGHPLSEAELSGQQDPDLPAVFDRQGYEEKPDDVTSGQLNRPRNFRS